MIRSINLDSMFVPTTLPEIEFEMMTFPGGESHIKLNPRIDYDKVEKVVITARISNGDDIMQILLAKDALEQYGIKDIDLIIPYVPYARQDRAEVEGEAFSLKVFTTLINNANFNRVIVFDAHSDVSPALLNKCHNVKNHQYVLDTINKIVKLHPENTVYLETVPATSKSSFDNTIRIGKFAIISPDSGANKKINKLRDYIDNQTTSDLIPNSPCLLPVVKCDKKRNMNDGSLGGFEVMTDDLEGRVCIIVDDICSRGGTFMGLAAELKKKNAGDIYLIVSHYENSADEQKLKDAGIKGVYKTNSMNDHSSDFVKNYILSF